MNTTPYPADLVREVSRRRTFAIVSHPDAGKTTLTEKLLLFGGAIQLAGAVKARGDRRRATSDWVLPITMSRKIITRSAANGSERVWKPSNSLIGHIDKTQARA